MYRFAVLIIVFVHCVHAEPFRRMGCILSEPCNAYKHFFHEALTVVVWALKASSQRLYTINFEFIFFSYVIIAVGMMYSVSATCKHKFRSHSCAVRCTIMCMRFLNNRVFFVDSSVMLHKGKGKAFCVRKIRVY